MNDPRPEGHPFFAGAYRGRTLLHCTAEDRCQRIKAMDRQQLEAVLQLPDLQKTVRTAAERRLRKLLSEEASGQ